MKETNEGLEAQWFMLIGMLFIGIGVSLVYGILIVNVLSNILGAM